MDLPTGGYNVALDVPAIATRASLSGLQPLSFANAQEGPVKVKPLAREWNVPSTHAELVSEGIAKGLSAIGQGISARYQNKQNDAKMALAMQEKEAVINEQKLRLDETIRHNKEMETQRIDRTNATTPAAFHISEEGAGAPPEEPKTSDALATAAPVEDTYNPASESFYLRNTPPATATNPATEDTPSEVTGHSAAPKSTVRQPAPDQTQPDTGVLAGTPPAVSSPGASGQLPKDFGSFVTAKYTPALSQLDQQVALQGLTLANDINTGKYVPSEAGPAQPQAQTTTVDEPAKTQANEKYEALIRQHAGSGDLDQESANLLSDYYYKAHGVPLIPKRDPKTGLFTLDYENAMKEKDRQENISKTKKLQEQRISEFALQGLGSMNLQFNSTHNQTLTDLNKSIGALPQFLEEYENLTKHPTAQGINDLGLIDAYVRFAKGAAPNQMQIDEVKRELSLPDKIWNLYQNKKSGAFLPPDVRQNMLDVVTGTYNIRANMLNPKLRDQRTIVEHNFPNVGLIEEQKPHEYPLLRTKPVIEEEMSSLSDKGGSAATAYNAAIKAGNREEAKKLKAEFDSYASQAEKLKRELGKLASRNGIPDYKPLYGNFGWTPGSVGKIQPTFTQPVAE